MPSETDNIGNSNVVVDTDAVQLASLAALVEGCPFGNIYSGSAEQPTRQGLRELKDA